MASRSTSSSGTQDHAGIPRRESPESCPQRPVDLDGVLPCNGILFAHRSPYGVAVKGAADTGAFRGIWIVVPAQPGEAIPPAQALFDQRETLDLPRLETRLGAHNLVRRDAYPAFDDRKLGRALARQARQLTHLPTDWNNLIVRSALATDHADRDGLRRRLARGDFVATSMSSPSSSSSKTGTTAPAGVTVLAKAGIEAQRLFLPGRDQLSRILPSETIWTGTQDRSGDISHAR